MLSSSRVWASASASRSARGALLLALCTVTACAPPERIETRRFDGAALGATYQVTVAGLRAGADDARRARQCIDGTLDVVSRHLSATAPRSEIAAVSRNTSTNWIPVSTPLLAVVAAAQRVAAESDDAFDITIAPLERLWDVGPGVAARAEPPLVRPSPEFVHDAMAGVGYAWLELRVEPEPAVRKGRVPLELDVSALAPGYAVDRIGRCLARMGFGDHLVRIGGQVLAAGRPEADRSWRVAIEAPTRGRPRLHAMLALSGLAVATVTSNAGSTGEGRARVLDPRTGEPVRHALASVTVAHPRALLAGAYANALMVLGPEDGLALAERLALPALLLERVGQSDAVRERSSSAFATLRSPARQASL